MRFNIKRQETYSKSELLLRTFLGFFYILIPHYFVLVFYSIGWMFVSLGIFFSILFTRSFPKSLFDYQVKLFRYMIRLSARLYNLSDGYPGFSLDSEDENTYYDMEYTPTVLRRTMLVRTFFGAILLLPHLIILILRSIVVLFIIFISFFAILFTGEYPENMFKFMVEQMRWSYRVNNWMYFFTPDYPPFHGRELPEESMENQNEINHLVED
ncbi:MAG: hypothetical protein ACI8ZN_002747 [Bacteroidia bacterium]|jgi:ABC-type multidrug transport system fused ATPase/permease subunit